jgi:hypothetical protein
MLALPRPAQPVPPPTTWAVVQDDPWLQELITRYTQRGPDQSTIAAAGLSFRLARITSERAKTVVNALLSGDADHPVFDAPRWAAALDAEQRSWSLDVVRAQLDRLFDELRGMRAALRGGNLEHGSMDWESICIHRDDVESIVAILDGWAELRDELTPLDTMGAELAGLVPAYPWRARDERWARVRRIGDGSSWWASTGKVA